MSSPTRGWRGCGGGLSAGGRGALAARWFGLLPADQALEVLAGSALGPAEAAAVVAARPLADADRLPAAVRADLA